MESKEDLIKRLKQINEELRPIVFKSFKTDKELDNYEKENQSIFNEYFDNQKQIRELEWELMTPEQQARAKEVEYLVKLKTGQIKEGEE